MAQIKSHHKDLKRAVNEAENTRQVNRSFKSWYDMKTLKKIKLLAKDKLYALKQKLHS